jgi:hypothetical protein
MTRTDPSCASRDFLLAGSTQASCRSQGQEANLPRRNVVHSKPETVVQVAQMVFTPTICVSVTNVSSKNGWRGCLCRIQGFA